MTRPASSYAGGKAPPGRPTTPTSRPGSNPAVRLPGFAQRWTGSAPSSAGTRPSFGSGSGDPNSFNPGSPSRPTSNWQNYRILEGAPPPPGQKDSRKPVPGVTLPKDSSLSGTFGSQRMGFSPERFEAFPYGSISVTREQAESLYDNLSPAYQAWLTSVAQSPGMGTGASTGRSFWARLVSQSIDLQEQGLFMSPQQMASQIATSRGIGLDLGDPASYGGSGSRGGYGRGGFGGGGGGGTSRSIDLSSPTQARSIIMQTMQGVLGRDPSADEIAQFTKSLNEAQQASPTVVTAEGDTVTRSGGIEADVFAMDFVRNQEEFQEVQGTQFYRALMGALGGGGI